MFCYKLAPVLKSNLVSTLARLQGYNFSIELVKVKVKEKFCNDLTYPGIISDDKKVCVCFWFVMCWCYLQYTHKCMGGFML